MSNYYTKSVMTSLLHHLTRIFLFGAVLSLLAFEHAKTAAEQDQLTLPMNSDVTKDDLLNCIVNVCRYLSDDYLTDCLISCNSLFGQLADSNDESNEDFSDVIGDVECSSQQCQRLNMISSDARLMQLVDVLQNAEESFRDLATRSAAGRGQVGLSVVRRGGYTDPTATCIAYHCSSERPGSVAYLTCLNRHKCHGKRRRRRR